MKRVFTLGIIMICSTYARVSAAPHESTGPLPGADLEGPIAVHASAERAAPGQAKPVDLGSDRVAEAIAVPRPPHGGAVQFAFGDNRTGWVAQLPDSQQLPAAAYGDGKIYVSGGFSSVSFYAMDARTGRFEWAATNLEDNGPTAAVYRDGKVVFNTESCTLFVLDARTGKRLWFKWLGDPTLAQAALADNLIFAAHPSPQGMRLSAFRLHDGKEVWSQAITGELLAAPVVHGDSVYVSTLTGWIHRFEKARGTPIWATQLDATTAPWLSGRELFVSRNKDGMEQQIVVSIETGKLIREHHATSSPYLGEVPRDLKSWQAVWEFEGSRPIVSQGVRYVAMGGEIRATHAKTGEPLWIRRHASWQGERSLGSVALAGPHMVVATQDGQIFGLDIDTGYTLWAYDLDLEIVAEPIVARGWVYVTSKDGQVVGLEVGDTTLDGWHMFGGNPHHNGPVERAARRSP